MTRLEAIDYYNIILGVCEDKLKDTHYRMDIGSLTQRDLIKHDKEMTYEFISILKEIKENK